MRLRKSTVLSTAYRKISAYTIFSLSTDCNDAALWVNMTLVPGTAYRGGREKKHQHSA